MGYQVEDLGKNMAKLTIDCTAEAFDGAIKSAYEKNKSKIAVQGFRKGKAPLSIVAKMYGYEMFYEDAANLLIPGAYEAAAKESGLEIVSQPSIDVVQIEKGKDFIFTAEVATKPVATLGEYKGVKVSKTEIEVTEEEVDAAIKAVQEQNAREITVEDRPVAEGDTAVIDYEGFVDGVAFAGGKGENHPLVIGSHSFIEGFEEALIGKNAGEECDVNVTFPEQYHSAELAGKPAVFKCTVKAIKTKEMPALDDEFAAEVSEFETMAEYRESVKSGIAADKEKDARTKKEDEAVSKVVEGAQMDIPAPMVESTQRQMAEDFAYRLQMQGLNMEQYFQFTGLDAKQFIEQMKPQAEKRIQTRLVLEAVVAAEGLTVSEEEYEEEIAKMAEQYKMTVEKAKELIGEEEKKQIEMDMCCSKAVTFITDNAVEE